MGRALLVARPRRPRVARRPSGSRTRPPSSSTAPTSRPVGGPGAEREIRLSLDDLRALPSHKQISYIECAGNWRGFFQAVTGRTASGSQWGTGAIGCAEWGGPRLADVLALAGVRADGGSHLGTFSARISYHPEVPAVGRRG